MKKIFLLLTVAFTLTTSAQYAIVSAVDVKDGMEDQYLQLEEFFGPVLMRPIQSSDRSLRDHAKCHAWNMIRTHPKN